MSGPSYLASWNNNGNLYTTDTVTIGDAIGETFSGQHIWHHGVTMNIYTPLTHFQVSIIGETFPAQQRLHHGILGLASHHGILCLALHHGILGLGVRCLLSGTSMATSRLLKFDSSDSSELYTTAMLCFVNG